MPTTSARSTPRQRAELAMLVALLTDARDTLATRFYATAETRKAYEETLAHLSLWADWEKVEADAD